MKPLTDSHKYAKFMQSRDIALEGLLTKYQGLIGAVIDELKKRAMDIAGQMAHHGMSHYDARKRREEFQKRLQPWFDMATEETLALMTRLRKTTYALSSLGQTEGIARATGSADPGSKISGTLLDGIGRKDAPSGGPLKSRIDLAYARLLRDILDAFQLSQIMAMPGETGTDRTPESAADLVARVGRAFPRRIANLRRRSLMARLKEADAFGRPGLNDGYQSISSGVIDPAEWEQILEDYFAEHFPVDSPNRSAYSRVYYSEEPTDQGRYEWELENEVTQDFVDTVRRGENDAANAQGINDFQWIAIIDSKTDDCCLWRDGLTSEEIEAMLDGEHADDICDATVPPAHFNCRCRLVPMTRDIPEVEHSDLPDFETWLASQAVGT